MRNVTRRCSFSADEDTKERCSRSWHERHPGVCFQRLREFNQLAIWRISCCHFAMQVDRFPFRCDVSRQRLLPDRSRQ